MRQNVSMSVPLPWLSLESCPFQGVSYLGQGRVAMQEWWGWGGVSGAVLVNGWQVMRSPFHLSASLTAAMVSATSPLSGHSECRCVAVRGQPANCRDDYWKRSSSLARCRLASLLTSLHGTPIAFTQKSSETSSPKWDVHNKHGYVTTQRGF